MHLQCCCYLVLMLAAFGSSQGEPVREYRPITKVSGSVSAAAGGGGHVGGSGFGGPTSNTLMAEMAALKTMLASVQGSLITSVGLIQDQVDQMGKSYLDKVDQRLEKVDQRLESIDAKVESLQSKAHIWDTFQHHVTSWAALMSSVDSKVDHISRAQAEQQSVLNGQLSTLQSSLSLGLESVADRINNLETRMRSTVESSSQQTKEQLKTMKDKVASLHGACAIHRAAARQQQQLIGGSGHAGATAGNQLRSGHHGICAEIKDTVKSIYEKVTASSGNGNASRKHDNDSDNVEEREEVETEDRDNNETPSSFDDFELMGAASPQEGGAIDNKRHISELFRRLSLPFKKAGKRLREMEEVTYRFQNNVDQMTQSIGQLTVDMDRRYTDFYNTTVELFQQQHQTLESYERQFASLRQCCSGTASDLSGFEARALPILRRLDHSLQSSSFSQVTEATPRSQESRFTGVTKVPDDVTSAASDVTASSDGIVALLKEHEKIMVEGFERTVQSCSMMTSSNSTAHQQEFMPMTSSNSSVQPRQEFMPVTSAVLSSNDDETRDEVDEMSDLLNATREKLRSCEELMTAGYTETDVYVVGEPDDDDDDDQAAVAAASRTSSGDNSGNNRRSRRRFENERLCDQTTAGGGWTVLLSSNVLLVCSCFFLSAAFASGPVQLQLLLAITPNIHLL